MPARQSKILVIGGDLKDNRVLALTLRAAGYQRVAADTGANGLASIANYPPDIVILHHHLPDMSGAELLRRARYIYEGPIVVLSTKDREAENVRLLDLGADDYVAKPFHREELLARLRVAARNRPSRIAPAPVVRAGECEIDLLNALVKRGGAVVKLTPREYELLARLVEGRGRVLTHQQLLTMIWGPSHTNDVQYLRVFVAGLRRKLEVDPASPRCVVTEAGIGYRLITD